jgi:hypothetical protein
MSAIINPYQVGMYQKPPTTDTATVLRHPNFDALLDLMAEDNTQSLTYTHLEMRIMFSHTAQNVFVREPHPPQLIPTIKHTHLPSTPTWIFPSVFFATSVFCTTAAIPMALSFAARVATVSHAHLAISQSASVISNLSPLEFGPVYLENPSFSMKTFLARA